MTCPVTVSSVLRTFGRALTKRPKGVTPVTTIGNGGRCNESSGAASEVVLGVDTHLDVHLAVALDHLGRRLGTFLACRRPRTATRASSPGRKVSDPSGAPEWKGPAATAPNSPGT